jgi:TetR/AcrR family transcriptional regulator, tetracycline repressor protein
MGATRQPGLDRATVAAAALELLDEVGLDGLTVRRLATALGVQAPALYWHFREKQELLDLMAQELQASVGTAPRRAGEPWPDWIAQHARQRRRLLLSCRDGARLVIGSTPGAAVAREAEAGLQTLVGIGFTPAQGLRALIAIGHYVTGFAMEEQSAQRRSQHQARTSQGPEGAEVQTPILAAAIRDGGPPETDEAFEQGLWMLIDGMRALLQRSATPRIPQ